MSTVVKLCMTTQNINTVLNWRRFSEKRSIFARMYLMMWKLDSIKFSICEKFLFNLLKMLGFSWLLWRNTFIWNINTVTFKIIYMKVNHLNKQTKTNIKLSFLIKIHNDYFYYSLLEKTVSNKSLNNKITNQPSKIKTLFKHSNHLRKKNSSSKHISHYKPTWKFHTRGTKPKHPHTHHTKEKKNTQPSQATRIFSRHLVFVLGLKNAERTTIFHTVASKVRFWLGKKTRL